MCIDKILTFLRTYDPSQDLNTTLSAATSPTTGTSRLTKCQGILDKFEGALQTHGFRKLVKASQQSGAGSGAAAIRSSKVNKDGGSMCLVVRSNIEDMLDEAKGMINAITGQ